MARDKLFRAADVSMSGISNQQHLHFTKRSAVQVSTIENPEEGQALVITLLALLLGVLLVSGFLYFASTSQRATTAAVNQTTQRYSADAGIERGLWLLQSGGVTDALGAIGSSVITQTTINNFTVTIIITRTTSSP